MRQTTFTQSGAPGCVIGWTNFSPWYLVHGFHRNFQCFISLSTSFVSSCYSILECYDPFSGVKLSIKVEYKLVLFYFSFAFERISRYLWTFYE